MHQFVRTLLESKYGNQASEVPILYGGSVKPNNARRLLSMPHVDGGWVGGASLKAFDFLFIIESICIFSANTM